MVAEQIVSNHDASEKAFLARKWGVSDGNSQDPSPLPPYRPASIASSSQTGSLPSPRNTISPLPPRNNRLSSMYARDPPPLPRYQSDPGSSASQGAISRNQPGLGSSIGQDTKPQSSRGVPYKQQAPFGKYPGNWLILYPLLPAHVLSDSGYTYTHTHPIRHAKGNYPSPHYCYIIGEAYCFAKPHTRDFAFTQPA